MKRRETVPQVDHQLARETWEEEREFSSAIEIDYQLSVSDTLGEVALST